MNENPFLTKFPLKRLVRRPVMTAKYDDSFLETIKEICTSTEAHKIIEEAPKTETVYKNRILGTHNATSVLHDLTVLNDEGALDIEAFLVNDAETGKLLLSSPVKRAESGEVRERYRVNNFGVRFYLLLSDKFKETGTHTSTCDTIPSEFSNRYLSYLKDDYDELASYYIRFFKSTLVKRCENITTPSYSHFSSGVPEAKQCKRDASVTVIEKSSDSRMSLCESCLDDFLDSIEEAKELYGIEKIASPETSQE